MIPPHRCSGSKARPRSAALPSRGGRSKGPTRPRVCRRAVVPLRRLRRLHGPAAGRNQLAVFTDARAIPEEAPPAARARDGVLGDGLRLSPGRGRTRPIRIFTPASELPFAGHPVIGSAFVLAGPLQLEEIRLETGVGVIPVRLEREGAAIVFGRMEQPVPRVEPCPTSTSCSTRWASRLGAPGRAVRQRRPQRLRRPRLGRGGRGADPDLNRLARMPDVLGVSCSAGAGEHWKTRMFAPADGVPEDPATGSAAGPLAVHLARHGLVPFGEEIVISQGSRSAGRPRSMRPRRGTGTHRARRGGRAAVVVARGEFRL